MELIKNGTKVKVLYHGADIEGIVQDWRVMLGGNIAYKILTTTSYIFLDAYRAEGQILEVNMEYVQAIE